MKNCCPKQLILLLCGLYSAFLQAQDPYYINFDTGDGLPSSETYFIETDEQGLIWVATDRGICTYDGYRFKTYTTEDGLAHNTNLKIFKSPNGELWFPGWDGSITVYRNGRFIRPLWVDDLIKLADSEWIEDIVFLNDDEVILMTHRGSRNNLIGEHIYHVEENDNKVNRLLLEETAALINSSSNIYQKPQAFYYHEFQNYAYDLVCIDQACSRWLSRFSCFNKELKILRDSLFYLNEQRTFLPLILPQANLCNNIYKDQQAQVWISTENGLFLFPNADLSKAPQQFFKGLGISSIKQDREGNYWISSLRKGIFMVPSFQMRSFVNSAFSFEVDAFLSVGAIEDDFLLFGNQNSEVFVVNEQVEGYWMTRQEKDALGRGIKRISVIADTAYTNWRYKLLKDGDRLIEEIDDTHSGTMFYTWVEDNYYMGANSSGFSIFNSQGQYAYSSFLSSYSDEFPFYERITCLERDEKKKRIWMGTLEGLRYIDWRESYKVHEVRDSLGMLDCRIEDIDVVRDSIYWLATMGKGLLCKVGEVITQITQADGLSSSLINNLCMEGDSVVWVATNLGLDRVAYSIVGQAIKVEEINNFTTKDGLITNFINDIALWNDYIWLATNKGINYFTYDALQKNETAPFIALDEVRLGDQNIVQIAHPILDYDENDLSFHYTGVSFIKPDQEAFYRYQLSTSEGDTAWHYTNNRSLQFLNLSPGDYQFTVSARNKFGYWAAEPVHYYFKIQPHFTQTIWFALLLVSALLALVVFYVSYRSRNIRRDEEQKRILQAAQLQTKEAELNALRNQMNPHFVFNSLNSIQNFMFKNDKEKANHYLTKFSRLMRNSLEFSKLEYISLSDEIEFINAYIDLEQMRFPDKFDYQLKVMPDVPIHHYHIPPLLFQPVLENSIKHAFKYIKHKGILEILISEEVPNQLLKVVLQDNGSGFLPNRQKNKASTKKKHHSLGLTIIKNRIQLLNAESNSLQASFEIQDRREIDPSQSGVRSVFIIPIKLLIHD
ncbi:MAG: histidine kinase [Bacteroidota bacterium]